MLTNPCSALRLWSVRDASVCTGFTQTSSVTKGRRKPHQRKAQGLKPSGKDCWGETPGSGDQRCGAGRLQNVCHRVFVSPYLSTEITGERTQSVCIHIRVCFYEIHTHALYTDRSVSGVGMRMCNWGDKYSPSRWQKKTDLGRKQCCSLAFLHWSTRTRSED